MTAIPQQSGGAPWEVIGQAFVTKYYEVFDNNKDQIITLYHVSR